MNRPVILLGLPESYGLSLCIKQNLIANGFQVVDISFPDYQFRYENNRQRFYNLLRKIFLRDRSYKVFLKFQPYQQKIETAIASYTHFDYALLIRAEIYPKQTLLQIRAKTKQMIGYQWDGLQRYPLIYNYIPFFDRFFVFDYRDLKSELPLLFTTNFFLGSPFKSHVTDYRGNKVLLFNSYYPERMATTFELLHQLTLIGVDPDFRIYKSGIVENYTENGVSYFKDPISYADYLGMASGADVLVDICLAVHEGLSFRFFEAIGYGKKIITTNKNAVRYDFYHPQNVFIIGVDPWTRLPDFVKNDPVPLKQEMIEKYSFRNWIRYVLNTDPFYKIDKPD